MFGLLKFLKNSKLVGLMAQVGVILGSIDAAGVIDVLPPKVGAAVAVVGGVVSWYNRTFGGEVASDATKESHAQDVQNRAY